MLLALYSLGGEAEGIILQPAFKKLHETRATRWGLRRRPEDWAIAMAELTNAFIRPTGRNAFGVLDPSVLDLVTAVIRKAPENAVDVVLGAVDFSQFERMWKLGTSSVPAIKTTLNQSGPTIAAAISSLILRRHRLVAFENGTGRMHWTDEARLSAALPLADQMRTHEMLALAKSLGTAMVAAWADRGIHINDGVEVLRRLERVSWQPLKSSELEAMLADRLVAQARIGCRSDELREIVSALDLDGPENAATLAALQEAFENSRDAITSEIGECRKNDEFKGLEEDYRLFASHLGVDVSAELAQLEDAYSEYNAYEEQRADEMMDDYKDRYRESRASDDSVRDLFASLRSDRGD